MTENNHLVLVDGYAQIYRSFYAMRELTNARGEPTNALFVMSRLMLKLDKQVPHEFGAVVMDKGKSTHRLALLPEYKATRPPMPDALRSQIPIIREWIDACGWIILEEEGQEADDIIAAVVKVREGRETEIITHDKDLGQLVQPGVSLLMPGKKGQSVRMDSAAVQEKFGVPPSALRDYLALVGDASDNIPGVAGVGPKTAVALLNQFDSIDGMLANPDAIEKKSLREKIRTSVDILHRNCKLVALDTKTPDGWQGIASLRRRDPDWDRLLEIAHDNGFKSLVSTLNKARSDARNPMLF